MRIKDLTILDTRFDKKGDNDYSWNRADNTKSAMAKKKKTNENNVSEEKATEVI